MKNIILVIATLFIGIFLGYFMTPTPEPPSVQVEQACAGDTKLADLKAEFSQLANNEVSNYVNETNPYLKGEKADLLLMKLLKVFLVDIGLRIAELNTDFNQNRLDYSQYKSNEGVSGQETPVIPLNCQYSKMVCEQKFGAFEVKEEKLNWRQKETSLKQVYSEQDMESFLSKVKVNNFGDYLSKSKIINRAYVKVFEGKFTGIIDRQSPKKQKLDIELSLSDVTYNNGVPSGLVEIAIYEDGNRTSHNNSKGVIKDFGSFADRSQGFIVKASPSLKIQIYSSTDNAKLFGNVYEKTPTSSSYNYIGSTVLTRE